MISAEAEPEEPLSRRLNSARHSRPIADFVDLKSPFTLGHAASVSALGAGREQGWVSATARSQHSAAQLVPADLGRLGVSNAIWDKEGPLGAGEWGRVRMCPYLTRHPCSIQSAALARLSGAVAISGAPGAPRRFRLPRGLFWRGNLDAGTSSGQPMPINPCASLGHIASLSHPKWPPKNCTPR